MGKTFDIVLTDRLFEVFPISRIVDTEFYVVCDGLAFPGEEWTDSALSIISSWIEEVVRHKGCKKSTYLLYFMDGSYWIEVQQEGEELILRGIDDGKDKEIKFIVSCTVQELRKKLKKTLYKLESIIQTNEKCDDYWRGEFQPVIDHYKEVLRKSNTTCQGVSRGRFC
jgi:hypothetical protein